MKHRSLSFRILAANLLVVAVGAAALFVTARVLGPQLFDDEVQNIGQRYGWSGQASQGGGGPGRTTDTAGQGTAIEQALDAAFTDSLDVALLVALGAGAVAAVVGAIVVSRRILAPLDHISAGVRALAGGDHGARVDLPHDRELADLAGDVNELGESLAATEAHRTRLVGDLAHELRTPITAIEGFMEGLEDGVFQPDAGTLAAIRAETRRLGRLAEDLGAVSRADEEAFDLTMSEIDLGAVAGETAAGMRGRFATEDVRLDVGPLPAMPIVGDADRLGQVFSNLLRNALQHTPSGGSVTIAGMASSGEARITITDTGSGIRSEHLSKVFDRFFRADADSAAGGSGVGLTISRAIARAHGGDVTAHSDGPGTGATFAVSIPLAP